jgi:hypothetical protein
MEMIKLGALEDKGIHFANLQGEFHGKELVRVRLPEAHVEFTRRPKESAEGFEARVVHELTSQRSADSPLHKVFGERDEQT